MEGRRYEIKFDNRIERAFERCSNVVKNSNGKSRN